MIDRRLCAFLLVVGLGPRPALPAGVSADDVWVAKGKRAAAPKLALRDLEGQRRQLAQLKGKVVVVNFWATWCGPCRRELPAFTKVYSEYRDRGVEMVGAANETRAERAKVAPRTAGDRTLFWRTVEHAAARSGKWKYLADKDGGHLFDLSVDPGEKADRRQSETATFDRLERQYVEWDARMLPRPKEHGRVRS